MEDGRWEMEEDGRECCQLAGAFEPPHRAPKREQAQQAPRTHALRDIRLRLCRLCRAGKYPGWLRQGTPNPNRAHPNRPQRHGGWSLELGISLRFEAWCLEF